VLINAVGGVQPLSISSFARVTKTCQIEEAMYTSEAAHLNVKIKNRPRTFFVHLRRAGIEIRTLYLSGQPQRAAGAGGRSMLVLGCPGDTQP
jgi:hypothetical protein